MEEGARVTQDMKEKVGLDETLPEQRRQGGPGGKRRRGNPVIEPWQPKMTFRGFQTKELRP